MATPQHATFSNGRAVRAPASPGDGEPEARLQLAFRNLGRGALGSVATSLWQFRKRGVLEVSDISQCGIDDLENIVITNVRDFGWHAVNVIEDNGHPPWSYSIGFYDTWNFPEIILIGRSRATADHALSTIADALDDNQPPDLSLPIDQPIPGASCHLIEVHERYYADYVGFARRYYRRRTFPLYQLVWPNHLGQFPWDEKASQAFKEWQPQLGAGPRRA